ncbi:MAG: transcription-repair coupling factor [Cytophagales bacterium]|nr:transcription-repair coupling factor [Cytophagales bacterium]
MNKADFLKIYQQDSQTLHLFEWLRNQPRIAAKGLVGSQDAVILASINQLNPDISHVAVLHDKEEAAYFHTDLQSLLKETPVHFYPSSFKRPYQVEETENANVLQRAEVLNQISQPAGKGWILVTYPEALAEKVINKTSLKQNTYSISKGDEIDLEFLAEILFSYGFEKTDFVYEAGQFAVRGGIVDIYSFAGELPFRLELFGDEVDSIRSFNPETQLSDETLERVDIIPNVQTKLLEERRDSLFSFMPKETKLWLKDYELTRDVLEKHFNKAVVRFEEKTQATGSVLLKPELLFENQTSFEHSIEGFTIVEFGNRFLGAAESILQFEAKPQPSFNKNFELLTKNLEENQDKGLRNFITAESERQLNRLQDIFEEINPHISFKPIRLDLRAGFVDKITQLVCYTDHQIFERFHRFKTKEKFSKSKAMTLKELRSLQVGDYVTHVDYGIARFAGLERMDVKGRKQETIRLIYRDNDLLYVGLQSLHKVSKYAGKEGVVPTISKLGSQEWENKKKRVKRQVQDIAEDLINLYAERKSAKGFAFDPDGYLQAELESSFLYEDTPDQAKATLEVKQDMELRAPMDRLVCGDVGFGKTEVAVRAAFKAVCSGKQVAVLVPTTILAMQHYKTFTERLKRLPVKVEYVNRFKSAKQVREILKNLKEGTTDILIGTHRIVNKDVQFKDLGLMVIDEEQKFGVKVKEKLKEMRVNVDALTLTATPIPRTLHFSLMGARDLSVIATPPPNRQPVTTEIHSFSERVIRDAVSYELRRGGQVFFVHNRIEDIEGVALLVKRLVPDARMAMAHGQMEGAKLERIMTAFIEGEYDVLVSTNIIESGLDIPNANTIIVNRAHMFGLSDLHQMRGRVGRSNRKAFCYLLSPPVSTLTSEARKRLSTLEEFTELGDGFKVAMRDLDIRGAGNLLGAEQSGFIADLGFELYHKILDDAVKELKQTKFRELFKEDIQEEKARQEFVDDCLIETDWELMIPETYVSNMAERLSLYAQLDKIKEEEKLRQFEKELTDRFGKMPSSVQDLIRMVRIREQAKKLGFERLFLKNGTLKGYFLPAEQEEYFQSAIFGKVLQYVQLNAKQSSLKELKTRLMLKVEGIEQMPQLEEFFSYFFS